METYNRNDDNRNYIDLMDIIGGKNPPAQTGETAPRRADPAKINSPMVLDILERLSPGVSQLITETVHNDEELASRLKRGETDIIDVYQMLENTARPQVAPTARTANNMGAGAFNAHTLSAEEFARIQQLAHSGHNVRI